MKKTRLAAFLLAVVMLIALMPAGALASKTMYVKSGTRLCFRSEMKISPKNVISVLSPGTKVTVLNEYGTWSRIQYNGTKGYVKKSYLTSVKPSTTTTGTTYYVKTVDGNGVNMRKGPGMSYAVLKVIRDNKAVTVLSTSGRWWKVRYNGTTGYIYSRYLSKTK